MTRIKVCGNTHPDDVALAVELGVDLLGFIFATSKRQLTLEQGRALTATVPAGVQRVGVFIDEPAEVIAPFVEASQLTAIQVYRPLTAADRRLGVDLFPALRIRDSSQLRGLRFDNGDHPLLDTWVPDSAGGGSGRTWDWGQAREVAAQHAILVSGGLDPVNVGAAIRQVGPWGVDVCSGVEARPGRKDPARLRAFVEAVREADRA